MKYSLIEVGVPPDPAPRKWTRAELEVGAAPEGLYSNIEGKECILVIDCASRAILYVDNGRIQKASYSLSTGPFVHIGSVHINLELNRSQRWQE